MGVATVTSSKQVWDALVGGSKWTDSTITYSFTSSASDYGSSYSSLNEQNNGYASLNATQKAVVQTVFAEVSSFTNLSFSENTGSDVSSATMKFGKTLATSTAHAYYPGNYEAAGDSWFRNNGTYDNPVMGNYAYNEGFYHEIGHALGLAHGHEVRKGFLKLNAKYDSNEYTVMTYRDYVGDSTTDGSENETWGNAQSYMMYDIAALQYLYGANYSDTGETFSGDTVYTFSDTTGEMFINGDGVGTPGGNRIFRTIWDGNGTDTYDLSNYTTDLKIDLRPGEWSTFSQDQLADLDGGSRSTNLARGNVANALLYNNDVRSLIENAVGGSGNDTITGNQGNNELWGGTGNDKIYGGLGNDTLHGGDGNDMLYGDAGNDTLYGDAGSDTLNGGVGNDSLNGGAGDDSFTIEVGVDTYDGGDGNDTFSFAAATKALTLNLTDATLNKNDAAGETYANIETFIGTRLADTMTGDDNANIFDGGAGNDILTTGGGNDRLIGGAGNDTLTGGDGSDTLIGGAGMDKLYGGAGTDIFVFNLMSDSTSTARDFIYDFSLSEGDLIDLSAIDANTKVLADQAFTWVSTTAFSGVASELRVEYGASFTTVSGDLNGDKKLDFAFNLNKGFVLTADSFIL
ncbi:M10 family metallopeptidase C-terminal domain-containing protein [Rhizobium paknamense]|uniref:Serralysin n=1 Tax=Rhizobium paknamense TaxID=1206817 RepID=A0ABU0IA42_9HYPH|nr:M10 family metallopeptidase C-terminal domain-containing protein [Rhizobium paknamense]MDQ0454340.1 serralysin [Rhizobium paknamense]